MPKTISDPTECLAQTVHLSCVKISTTSKRTETSFRLSLITYEYHWSHPKRFLSLWYTRRQLCTYLAPTRTLSPNEPKRDSTLPTSPCSSIAPILHRHWLPTDQNETPHDPRHQGVPSGVSKMISKPMVCSAQTVHLSCTKTGSQRTETRLHMTHVT